VRRCEREATLFGASFLSCLANLRVSFSFTKRIAKTQFERIITMANGYNDNDALNATWKEVYAPEINKLVPQEAVFMKEVPFAEAEKMGDKFIEPVQVAAPQGITHLGQNASVETLLSAKAGLYKEAQIDGYGLVGREAISYSTAAKMASDKSTFVKWANLLAPGLKESIMKRLEIAAIWGGHSTGLGVVSAVSNSTVTTICTISAATWSAGIWGGLEGATVDVWTTAFGALRTTSVATITKVDFENKQITLVGDATQMGNVAATDIIVFQGAVYSASVMKEMLGLAVQAANTTATMWNIDAAAYSLWKGNTYGAAGAMTMAKCLAAAGKCAARGLKSGMDLFVSVDSFNVMNTDQAALRSFDKSYRPDEAESGNDRLVFHGPAGRLSIRPHLYMKNGYALGVSMQSLKRIGSTDVTFNLPGKNDGEVFLHLPDKNGYEIRAMSEQAIYTNKPCHSVLISGIS
jgi:hypothetical protein